MASVQQSMRMRSNDFYASPANGLATAYYKIEFDGPFDTAQWLITSRVTSGTPGTYKVQMAVTDVIAVDTVNNAFVPMRAGVAYNETSANGWQNATFGGAASKQIGLAPVSANNYGVISMMTDALPLASIARADGKPGGILLVKVVQSDTSGQFTQDSSANATWDAARSGSNAWFREFFVTKRANVDGIATLTALPTSVSEGSTGYAICGCPIVSSSTATSGDLILFTGDSRKSAAYSTYQFNNTSRQAVMSLSSGAHPLCTVDAAGSGHAQDQYLAVAMDLLNAGVRPTIIGLPGFSQNGFTTYSAFKTANDNFMSSVRAISGLANVKFVIDTDYYTSGYAAAKEAYRQQCVAYAKSLANGSTVFCFDSDAIMTDYSNSAAPVLRSAYMNGDGVHANQAGQDAMSYGDKNGAGLMALYRNILGITDTTAPTLTIPSATTTGSNSANGAVKTNESGGVLYYLASTNPTETAAKVMAAASKAPVVAGTQTVAFAGLPAGTVMYPHYVHVDDSGNVSSVADGGSFITQAMVTATAAALASVAAQLSASIALSASVSAVATASGTVVGVAAQLSSSASGSSTVTGTLTTNIALAAAVIARASASAMFPGPAAFLSASVSAAASAASDLATQIVLTAIAKAQASASGVLTGGGLIITAEQFSRDRDRKRVRLLIKGLNFSPKRAAEKEIFAVDYAHLLVPGETISSPAWSISAVVGDDDAASSMLTGQAAFDGTIAAHIIGGGVPGVEYAPVCIVHTSLGQTLALPEVGEGHLYISQ